MPERLIEPVAVNIRGQELRFLLSHGAVRRVKKRYSVKNWSGVVARLREEEDPVPILYECIVDRPADLSEDAFADLLPFAMTMDLIRTILGDHLPEPGPTAAPGPGPIPTPTIPTGPDSGDSPASGSD